MCIFSSPKIPAPVVAAPTPEPEASPQLPDKGIQAAGQDARKKAAAAAGPLLAIYNVAGPQGLTTPADTTTGGKTQLGA
jgi:hypothetical protein